MIKLIVLIFSLLYYVPCKANKNVVFIIGDDLKPALGSYGDLNAYTPNIDRLSSQSFVFTKAYAQHALCAPSRNSLLTSRRPDSLHLYDFYSYWRTIVGNFTTLPQYFKEHGYHTHSIGKIFHPGLSSNFSDDQPYSWSQNPFHPKTEAYKNAKVCQNSDGSLGKNLICPVVTEFQPDKTLPDLESFFFHKHHSFHKPHIPFKFPTEYLDYHPLDKITLPNIRVRDDIKKLNISFPYGPVTDDLLRQIKQSYYSSVTYIDDLIGQILEHINLNQTIVVLTGDHGWSIGEHGEFSKYSNFQEATGVPLIIHVPNLSKRKVTIESFVELVDIFPTLVDLTQVSAPLVKCPKNIKINTCTEGRSLLPIMLQTISSQRVTGKLAAFTQYPRPGPYPTMKPNSDKPHLSQIKIMGYTIIMKHFRYTEWVKFNTSNFIPDWNQTYGEELYALNIDPDENENIADRKEVANILKYMKKKLMSGWRYI
ncbi:hypothetical protein GWI33_011123 [Rhynchophorus ferrugineus]|uniref:Sulfatase N-terminal domain-containing protein n=1 Tax=Rhynchophorus ferrugineus TaxID=354439 RepID=A0A834MK52_RHYFE|nr:hypothetical protein GWI33_011123 [Rhynchophorus ferrugineus]